MRLNGVCWSQTRASHAIEGIARQWIKKASVVWGRKGKGGRFAPQ